MLLQITNIEVFEAPETAQMKKQADSDDLALRHHRRPFKGLTENERSGRFIKIFTELIWQDRKYR
jgi:hypothetical protein